MHACPLLSATARHRRPPTSAWLVGVALALLTSASSGAPAAPTLVARTGAPDFTLPSAAGPNLRLQEQRGRVVMLNFWATWCGPCRREMPQLNRLYNKYKAAGFVLVGVNVDEDPRNAVGLAQKLGVQFPVVFDSAQRVSHLYDLDDMPSTVLIDRDGRVRYLHRGYRDGVEDSYDHQIAELLRE